MQPDPSTPSHQGSGTKANKTQKTVAETDIPDENRELSGVKESIDEGALPESTAHPRVSSANEGRRNVNRGLHS